MTRALVIDTEAKEAARRVIEYASREENWFTPEKHGVVVPGDDPRYVAHIEYGYRCVYTVSQDRDSKLFRHLSISVDGPKYPNQFSVGEIAALFGFTGWKIEKAGQMNFAKYLKDLGWIVALHEDEHCIVVAQPLEQGNGL